MSLHATAHYPGPCPKGLLQAATDYLQHYSLPMESAPGKVSMCLPRGRTTLALEAAGFRLEVEGADAGLRHQLCEGAVFMLEQICPEAAPAIAWEGVEAGPGLPPGMHHATLASVTRISPNFLRIEMDCAGTAEMLEGGMHFSLMLPPAGRAPVWPHLNAAGRTVWPKGADKLHRAVFTFVARDARTGRFSFDLFEHAGGPSTDWALAARPGDLVAISGPGGGTAPLASHLVIAGDETALPAIRDILQNAPDDLTGLALIETGNTGDRLIGRVPDGVTLRWLDRAAGETLETALAEVALDTPRLFLWVAAEAGLIRRIRGRVAEAGAPARTHQYLAAYWTS